MKKKSVYILEKAINHALGKSTDKICSWNNKISSLPIIDSSELGAEYMTNVPVMKNQNVLALEPSELKKMDGFCALTVDGIKEMNIANYPKDTMGVFLGSCLGGLNTAEKEMKVMCESNSRSVSPFLSIAMFYSSSISQISIFYNITGPCYLFSEGYPSGFSAIIHVYEYLLRNELSVAITGASDMPFSPTCFKAYKDAGLLKMKNYITDGSALFVLGLQQYTGNKKCIEIAGIGRGFFWPQKLENSINQALNQCIEVGEMDAENIDLVILSDNYFENQKVIEKDFFQSKLKNAKCLSLSSLLGNSFSSTSVQKMVIAESILSDKEFYTKYFDANSTSNINNAIISSIDITGNCLLVLLKK